MCYSNKSWAVSSAVERLPYKQDATGSNPVPPIQQLTIFQPFTLLLIQEWT